MSSKQQRTSPQFQKASSIFFIAMGTFSLVIAGVVLSIPALFAGGDPAMRWFFVLVFVIYGVYRIYLGVTRLKKSKQNVQTESLTEQ